MVCVCVFEVRRPLRYRSRRMIQRAGRAPSRQDHEHRATGIGYCEPMLQED